MSEIKLSYCVGGSHMSGNVDSKVTEKINPRTKKRVKIIQIKMQYMWKKQISNFYYVNKITWKQISK